MRNLVAFREVFRRPVYIFTTLLAAFLFYEANVLIKNFPAIYSLMQSSISLGFSLVVALSIGFYETVTSGSFITLIIISFLFGILLSMVLFKIKMNAPGKKSSAWAGAGLALGVLAPGCAACGIGVLSIIGLGGATLSLLPLDGLEISILAIILLLISIYHLSQTLLKCEACQVKLKNERRQ